VLNEPPQTAYDLRWRMFGVPIRVHPFFWLLSAMLGWSYMETPNGGPAYLLMWIFCVFTSVLFHEFGHVLMGRLFGSEGHIVLYSFGGLAIGSSDVRRRWQRVLVLLAGPVPPLAVAGIIYYFKPHIQEMPLQAEPDAEQLLLVSLGMLFEINFFWSLLNLLPIWPLDGGQVTRETCEGWLGERGTSFALGLSLVVAGLFALHYLMYATKKVHLIPYLPGGGFYMALLFILLAVGSFQALQVEHERQRYHSGDDDWPWSR
jgi:stage IV sporulation protein FB